MSLQALRRWTVRHPLSWVLGLALALAGAQFAAVAHELTHVATAASSHDTAHANATHDCPTCLMAAALGGAAPAPTTGLVVASQAVTPAAARIRRSFVARVTRAYASRAPPATVQAALAA